MSDKENQRPPPEQKKKLKLTYDEYKTMSNLIVYYMRKKEAEFEGRSAVCVSGGVGGSLLVLWPGVYLAIHIRCHSCKQTR